MKNIIDLDLVNIIENELLTEYKKVHENYYSYKGDDDNHTNKLLDDLSEVEEKIKTKFAAFETLMFSLIDSYKKSINDFHEVNAQYDKSYKITEQLIHYKFHLMTDILISVDDDIGII